MASHRKASCSDPRFFEAGRRPHHCWGQGQALSPTSVSLEGLAHCTLCSLPSPALREWDPQGSFLPHPSGQLPSSVSCEHCTPRLDGLFIFAKLFCLLRSFHQQTVTMKHDGWSESSLGGGSWLHPPTGCRPYPQGHHQEDWGPASWNAGRVKGDDAGAEPVYPQSEAQPWQ